ncbi:proprotein convertase subtilisin/kexin type 7-like [Mya arenaria]|uniref:proprotein convertase subtilisin/kexin type 7-like n=1 Tax=Mya arenaria TaxID=6604 RepID=UPI0022E0D1B9|nr:proprotein convertase subtilisin/kexin type 7-like [Mya arenaria]XP_052779041.1 proprotein convertase subtilisin/kexin type 7-like [Mya arenaria]
MEFYASSIYTITIASVGRHGKRPKYVRPGACILAATFGDFRTWSGDILKSTSNWDSCAIFQGTSAAAARASGMIAIMLEANPRLTCRDVQYIIVLTSSLENVKRYGNSVQNAAGLKFDKYFGFGLMNATAMVLKARVWIPVARQLSYTTIFNKDSDKVFTSVVSANTSVPPLNESLYPKLLEQVAVFVDIEISNTKVEDIDIVLKSPSKTLSYLLSHKNLNTTKTKSLDGPAMVQWTFTSVHFWGEFLNGEWKIFFKTNKEQESLFTIRNISISFYGVSDLKEASPSDISDESDIDDIAEKVCEFAGEQYEEIKRNPDFVIVAVGWIVGIVPLLGLLIWCYVNRFSRRPIRGDNQEHPEEELRLQQLEEPSVASDDKVLGLIL